MTTDFDKAHYLLRFDDLCPTMDWVRWQRFVPLLEEYGIRPILAVIPDNKDLHFERHAPCAGFWAAMRVLQAGGAAIGLHGFQHVCNALGRGLIPVNRHSEFAGAPEQYQRLWIQAGIKILRGHGLEPRIWVAPRHGFDRMTIRVLRQEGIRLISDGFAKRPYSYLGATWIPQQLWSPVERRSGLWTICIHPGTAEDREVAALERFLREFEGQFTSVDRVMEDWAVKERDAADVWFHFKTLTGLRVREMRRQLRLG